ncbi:MAG TPA: alpha-L-fucosidase C-terminal domain-containing protein, partial [Puia sp.]
RLKEMGAWLKINGEGIYNSRPIAPYSSGNVYLTQSKDSANVYAFFLPGNKEVVLPAEIVIDRYKPKPGSKITLLGTKTNIKWRQDGRKMIITVPPALQGRPIREHAVAFKIS